MRRDIKLTHLLYEMKRWWKLLLVIGLIGSIFMTARYYKTVRQQTGSELYASTSVIQVLENEETDDKEKTRDILDLKDENIAMMKSDTVLDSVLNETKETDGWTVKDLRSDIFCIGSCYGRVINVYVLTESQALSDLICASFSNNAVLFLNQNNKQSHILQETSEYGCATIAQTKRQDDPEKTSIVISPASAPAITIGAMVKNAMKGFIAFSFLAYICICIMYILNGAITYPDEIESIGIPLIGRFNEEKAEIDSNKALSMLHLAGINGDNILLLDLTSSNISKQITTYWKKRGYDPNVVSEADNDVEMSEIIKNNSNNIVLLIKSKEKKLPDILNLKTIVENNGNSIVGAIFADNKR